jgi:hypothetical protein
MKPSQYFVLAATTGALLMSAAPTFAQDDSKSVSESSREQTVALSEVPRPARDAAQKALGTTPTQAKIIVGTSPQEYELMAKNKSGKSAKVHVLADGTLMKNGKPEREAQGPSPTPR